MSNSKLKLGTKPKLWENSKTQVGLNKKKKSNCNQLENSNCDKTKKNQTVTKLKKSNGDNNLEPKYLQNSTHILTSCKNLNGDNTQNSYCDKAQKLKYKQNSKTGIMIKLKTEIVTKLKKQQLQENLKPFFGKNNLTPQQQISCILDSILQSCYVYLSLF